MNTEIRTLEIKAIRKPKPQKKKWYFPSGVWIMIKQYMGIKNSKFMNKFLEPLTDTEKSLTTKFKNVLKLCEEHPFLYSIVNTHLKINEWESFKKDEADELCDYELCVNKKYKGISNVKIFMKCFPELLLKNKVCQYQPKTPMLDRIKNNMIDGCGYDSDNNDEERELRRIKDEKWDEQELLNKNFKEDEKHQKEFPYHQRCEYCDCCDGCGCCECDDV